MTTPADLRDDRRFAAELFAAVPPLDAGDELRLHERLEDDAASAGLLDLAYRTLDTPYGQLLLVATPEGLVRVAFELEDHDVVLARLATTISPRILRSTRRLDEPARELDEYFAGERRRFDVPVDLRLSRGFRRVVLDHLRAVRYGATTSYASLAAAAGSPSAVRAVGTACATNPLPIVVPCHRVVRSDGTIGQYLGGTETKRALLAMESA
jgi:methylated-DNA-[protein]-cysteine S-methyltransferase